MDKKQSGRSMIEMLGTLAIIGVLTITVTEGFQMALNRHRANEIMNWVSACAVTAQTSTELMLTQEEECDFNGTGEYADVCRRWNCEQILLEPIPVEVASLQGGVAPIYAHKYLDDRGMYIEGLVLSDVYDMDLVSYTLDRSTVAQDHVIYVFQDKNVPVKSEGESRKIDTDKIASFDEDSGRGLSFYFDN